MTSSEIPSYAWIRLGKRVLSRVDEFLVINIVKSRAIAPFAT